MLEELEKELKCHDWYFEYSDDHSVWRAGNAHRTKIERLLKQVPVEDARRLYKQYAPSTFKCPV